MKTAESFLTRSGIIFTFLFALFTCVAFAQENRTPSITKSFTLSGPGNLEVRTSGGGITVEGRSGNEVEVQVFVRKNGHAIAASDPFMDELKQSYDLVIEKNGNTVIASAKRIDKGKLWNNVSIAFHVLTPHNISGKLNTSGGGIKVSGVTGAQEMNTSGGGITLEEINGFVKAHTSGGGIRVSRQDGDLNVHTSGGGITIEDARGNITGHTSGGGIRLTNIDGTIDVHTSGGGINITGRASYVKASTSGGNIHVDISDLSKGIELHTSGGGIKATIPGRQGLDLDLNAGKVNIDLKNFSGRAEKGRIVGAMNGGGMPVRMSASGGNIDVVF